MSMHLAWPLRVDRGRFVRVEQDSIEDVTQCVHAIARTPLGARPLAPGVGVEDPTFGPGVDAGELAAALMDAEPRASIDVQVTGPDESGAAGVEIRVELAP